MKLSSFILFLPPLLGFSVAWETDQRCLRRTLEGGDAMFLPQDISTMDTNSESVAVSDMTPNLRGTEDRHRYLQSSSTFMLKMYWQQGYCWQEEWIERKWCMSCIGSSCEEGEMLDIEACDSTRATQHFRYRAIAGTGGGQLRTATKSLCLDRVSHSQYILTQCRRTNLESQILVGIKTDGSRFELTPMGSSGQCIVNNNHHPTPGERLFSTSCSTAHDSHTSFWMSYNESSSVTSDSTQPLKALSMRNPECSTSQPCGRCEGDCDMDEECQGNLQCKQRWNTEAVPGCSGTGVSGKDYCY